MGGATVTAQYTPSGSSSALSATFSESVLAPNAINLVIAYVQSGLTTIQNLATTLLQATVSFTNHTSQAVTSLASWTVTPSAGATVAVSSSSNSATLTASQPGVISIIGSYLGLASNTLNLTVSAAPPAVQNASASLNVLGVTASTVTGNIAATDPQGYPLTYAISTQGNVGQATINNTTGAFTYTVTGHTTNSTDSFNVTVSNGVNSSVSQVSVMLNTDPLLRNQWHIQNLGYSAFSSVLPTSGFDMNVAGAWAAGYTGKGVKVAVVDTGLEIAHEDLAANVDVANSRNLLTGTTNPTPTTPGFDHGTQVAGIIGAVAFNGKGGRGVAYGATLRGYNLLGSGVSPSILNFGNALGLASYSADNDIFNESFENSPTNLDPTNNSFNAINNNLLSMRGNKGAIIIQSAGNDFVSFNDNTTVCNNANRYGVSCGDPATDTRRDGTLPIIVGAINADGVKSSYSNAGSAIWVVTPGGEYGYDSGYLPGQTSKDYKPAIVTTALTGCQNAAKGTTKINALDAQGQNTNAPQCQYTALMNGTSAAAPNLSGVVALMLEANPNLGYRDVRYILAKTAKKVDANNTGVTTTSLITGSSAPVVLEQGWVKNAAGYWFANAYGFGAVDAAAAVNMAKSYSGYLSAQQSASLALHYLSNVNVPNGNTTGSTMTFSMSPGFSTIEQVVMYINVTASPALTCNQIELTSPSGTKSILMHAANGFSNSGVLQSSIPGTRFMSNAFYGEASAGNWTLRFLDYCTSTTRTSILSTATQTLLLTGH
jgi:subtilisin family serine protease